MKFFLILVILALLSPMASYAQQADLNEFELQKVYLQPAQIALESQGIFAYVGNEWIPVESIGADSIGLYAMYKNPDRRTWRCARCNFINAHWDDYCQGPLGNGKCLTPRPKK